MGKGIYILGINESHVASAALLKDGEIIACASEERFTRKKGEWGYPQKAIEYCLTEAGIKYDRVDKVILGFNNLSLFIHGGSQAKKNFFGRLEKSIRPFLREKFMIMIGSIPFLYKIYHLFFRTVYSWTTWFFLERQHKSFLLKAFEKKDEDVSGMDHHLAHAFGAYYSSPLAGDKEEDVLVITNDGMGDDVCSRIYAVRKGRWQEIASTPNSASLGWLYLYVTEYLGMRPNEHEYKVMGLAPYAHKSSAEDIAAIFRKIMWVSDLEVVSKIPSLAYYRFIEKNFTKKRFDSIAGGIQLFTEEILVSLVKNAIAKTNINNIVLGGGVFMNVKANMEISKIPEIKNFFVMPSCGDESTAIGAAYYGYRDVCIKKGVKFDPKPLKSMYLGPSYSDQDIKEAIKQFKQSYSDFAVVPLLGSKKANVVAKILAQGNVVARFDGRMEFGARALGNRSILANPSNRNIVRTINDQIKGRDFWMPFAPVVLKEYADKYLVNSRNLNSPFMMIAFQTTSKAREEIISALHPYDYTARPQILEREINPEYYDIVDEFRKITGIGVLLNTSFNIHGEPIACTPFDALHTFQHSDLEFLLLGNYLLRKKVKIFNKND
ncbi:MAG: carbamoyltransferase C-terminal domain-containing protein [Candidatus Levybacteria bacterium]|nr:carbamoyltransferase C-terminal domain-containing protein [Candidatus Levybacteria bacterium]